MAQIDKKVKAIELDSNLQLIEKDWVKLTGITTDGGGLFKVWKKNEKTVKIVEEIGFSYGRIRTTIYLSNGLPIKVIETEENFGYADDKINFNELNLVYKEVIYVFDWEMDEGEIIRKGKRKMSEMNCSTYELVEPILERANITILEE